MKSVCAKPAATLHGEVKDENVLLFPRNKTTSTPHGMCHKCDHLRRKQQSAFEAMPSTVSLSNRLRRKRTKVKKRALGIGGARLCTFQTSAQLAKRAA
jgi:hypothetical protein